MHNHLADIRLRRARGGVVRWGKRGAAKVRGTVRACLLALTGSR